jgi:hypothetical protein
MHGPEAHAPMEPRDGHVQQEPEPRMARFKFPVVRGRRQS